jgi:anti-sigma factor RsiW
MHVDLERLHRYVDDELAPGEGDAVRAHLADCLPCANRARQVRRGQDDLMSALRTVDHPHPAVTAASVMSRARARPARWLRRAAGIVMALAVAGAAYAAPGSPIRDWLRGLVDQDSSTGTASTSAPPAPSSGPLQPESQAGIAVEPGPSLVIHFAVAQASGTLHVSLTDASRVVVRAARGAAVFGSAEDRLLIGNHESSGDFEIDVPRSARRVEIRVAGRRVLAKDDARITAAVAADTSGSYRIPLTAAP